MQSTLNGNVDGEILSVRIFFSLESTEQVLMKFSIGGLHQKLLNIF